MVERRSFEALQKWLRDLPCPSCLAYELELVLRCDLGYEECLRVARCRRCRATHLLEKELEQRILDEVEPGSLGRCPFCGSESTHLGLYCPMDSRRALAVGVCEHCHREFIPGAAA